MGPFTWPERFFKRHKISYEWENKPWSKCRFLYDFQSPEDEIGFFLRTDDESARYEGRVRPILDICSDVRLGDLLEGDHDGPQRKMGWLIDGSYDDKGRGWTSRPCLGALSARELAFELLKKRYAVPGEVVDEIVDAERRLIYITDLDCWSIFALVKTAPESLARLLGDFFQKHLCARASIGVSFASNGPPIFALSFHMPFRVWRTGNTLLCDTRIKKSNGKPLRTSRNMSLLMPSVATSTGSDVHGIYAGHVGCMIIGYDQWRWTAHLAIDTWFDTNEEVPGKVMRFQNDLQDNCVELDPLSCGNDDAKKPIWNPRAYFLRILGIRFDHVKDESDLLFQNLREVVMNISQEQKHLFSRLRPFSSGSDFQKYEAELEKHETNLEGLKEVLHESLYDFQETLKTIESFLSLEVHFFSNYDGHPGDASECYPFLFEIRGKFNEFARLCGFFNSLKEKCDDMTENCSAARMALLVKTAQFPKNLKRQQARSTGSPDATFPFMHTTAVDADGVAGFHESRRSISPVSGLRFGNNYTNPDGQRFG